MECKFLKHGIALSYDQVAKPCCVWKYDAEYKSSNHIDTIDIATWHNSRDITTAREMLANNQWPSACSSCQLAENSSRGDSMRLNGESAYSNYEPDDITLEIRPGSVCNFACQTCWPAASSRVAEYQVKAGLVRREDIVSNSFTDFDTLLPIRHRIKNVVLLGGEPFYDVACKRFLGWANTNLSADLLMFTNGSMIDWDFLSNYPKKITLVISLDSAGRPAEYIRHGTEWSTVLANYQKARTLPNVSVRVNVTMSVYNYLYLEQLFEILCSDWPEAVTFGTPFQLHFTELTVPPVSRSKMIASLTRVMNRIESTSIENGQWHNAINIMKSTIARLTEDNFSPKHYTQLLDYIARIDTVKHLNIKDYCSELADLLFV